MARFLVIVEKAGRNFSAYLPDLPGCVVAAFYAAGYLLSSI